MEDAWNNLWKREVIRVLENLGMYEDKIKIHFKETLSEGMDWKKTVNKLRVILDQVSDDLFLKVSSASCNDHMLILRAEFEPAVSESELPMTTQ
jgi:hypothetical protein